MPAWGRIPPVNGLWPGGRVALSGLGEGPRLCLDQHLLRQPAEGHIHLGHLGGFVLLEVAMLRDRAAPVKNHHLILHLVLRPSRPGYPSPNGPGSFGAIAFCTKRRYGRLDGHWQWRRAPPRRQARDSMVFWRERLDGELKEQHGRSSSAGCPSSNASWEASKAASPRGPHSGHRVRS